MIVCCDGLRGFPEAVQATWPQTTLEECTMHLIWLRRFRGRAALPRGGGACQAAWERLIPFLESPPELRTISHDELDRTGVDQFGSP